MQCTKIRSDAAEIKRDSYLEESKIRKDNGIMINTAPNKIELLDFGKSSTASNQFVTDPDVFVPASISPHPINSKDDTVPTSNDAIVLKVFIRNPPRTLSQYHFFQQVKKQALLPQLPTV